MTHRPSWLLAGLVLAASPALAADAFPSKPIRMIVPFAAGGTVDIVARAVSVRLGEELGQTVVVDNRGGAGGVIGAEAVAKADPDGYTLLMSNVALAYAPSLYKKLPFDVVKDFAPISLLGVAPSVLVVNPDAGYKTLAEFTQAARRSPGVLNYGSAGNGTSSHLAAELYRRQANVQVQHVPYRGGGPAVIAVLGGEVQFMVETLASVMPNIAAGKLQALAVTGENRTAALPDVPTMKEGGLTDYTYTTWFGMWAPANTPPALVQRLNAVIKKTLERDDVRQALTRSGVEAASSTPGEFGQRVAADTTRWSEIIKQSGVKAE